MRVNHSRRILRIVASVAGIALALIWLCSEQAWEKNILSDFPCAPPCWQGITPGTPMEAEQVTQILEEMPAVGYISQHSLPEGTEIRWWWKSRPWQQTETGPNSIFLVEGIVHDISLSVNSELTVEDILNKYGIPEATIYGSPPLPEEPYMWMTLVYPTRGLQFRAEIITRNDPVIKPSTRISEILYLPPVDSTEDWLAAHSDINLQPWPGYGALPPDFIAQP